MTIRVAMLIFVVCFASITSWLVARKPADGGITQTPPAPQPAEEAAAQPSATKQSSPAPGVVAISNEEKTLKQSLKSTIIPRVDIQDEPLEEALTLLNLKVRELKSTQFSHLDFVIRRQTHPSHHDLVAPPAEPPHAAVDSPRVSLSATDISIADAITRICEQTGHQWSIEDRSIILSPLE